MFATLVVNLTLSEIERQSTIPFIPLPSQLQNPALKIPDISHFKKIILCVPVIGFFPTASMEKSMREKIGSKIDDEKRTWTPIKINPQDLTNIVKVRNELSKLTIARSCLTIASLLAAIATGTLSANFLVLGYGFFVAISLPISSYGLFKNVTLLNNLEKDSQISDLREVYRVFL